MPLVEEHEKYKDDQPLNTIKRIRRILHSLDILTVEQWFKTGDSLYSVRVEIAGADIGQNGKGTTEAYALASAYGEFMERLQIGTLYPGSELGPIALQAEEFYYAPDEEYASVEQLLINGGPVVDHLLTGVSKPATSAGAGLESLLDGLLARWYGEDDREIKSALLTEWAKETPAACPANFICLPYYSLKEERLFAIPVPMLRLPYLHNGAAAGNSPEEALVQAMSEILERYVHKQIMAGKVTPPEIPPDYLKQNSLLLRMVKQIENQGFQVIVKDCSLNLGIPIVGVILVDRKIRSYFVKFGVHPSFEVALERCLTEAAQGRDLFGSSRDWMTRFQYHDDAIVSPQNAYNVLRAGAGSYPRSFFISNFSRFPGFPAIGRLNNKELLNVLTAILMKISKDVLVRDLSYLGFPTFQVIAPGVSEIFEYDGARLSRERLRIQVRQIMKNLPAASTRQLQKVVTFLVKSAGFVFETDTIGKLTGIAAQADFPWNKTPTYELMGAALYKMGKISEASGIIRQLARSPGVKVALDREIYYSAVSDYLAARAKGQDQREITSLLTMFYGPTLVTTVEEHWRDPAKVLDRFTPLPCWNCPICEMRDRCSQEKLIGIHKNFKRRQAENPLDQMNVQRIFR